MEMDLDLLKAIVDGADIGTNVEGSAASEVVNSVLSILRNSAPVANPIWEEIYDAIKFSYAGQADWGDDA